MSLAVMIAIPGMVEPEFELWTQRAPAPLHHTVCPCRWVKHQLFPDALSHVNVVLDCWLPRHRLAQNT